MKSKIIVLLYFSIMEFCYATEEDTAYFITETYLNTANPTLAPTNLVIQKVIVGTYSEFTKPSPLDKAELVFSEAIDKKFNTPDSSSEKIATKLVTRSYNDVTNPTLEPTRSVINEFLTGILTLFSGTSALDKAELVFSEAIDKKAPN